MDGGRDGGNVIHIIGGHGPRDGDDNQDDQPVSGREEFQIPSLGSSRFMIEMQRSSKSRHCKKFSSQEGCPLGHKCPYLHDDEIKGRERIAIILGPGSSSIGYRNGGATGNRSGAATAAPPLAPAAAPPAAPLLAPAASNSTVKPLSWKTKICNKWEQTNSCPFGSKCIFAHGEAELRRYGGGLLVDDEANPNKQVNVVASTHSSVARGGGSGLLPATSEGPIRKWKGPYKISRVYGDWIDDID